MSEREHYLTREQIGALLDERDELRERVRQLEKALAPKASLPRRWRLTPMEGVLLRALRAASPGMLDRERAMLALYSDRHEAPEPNAVCVLLFGLRRKLLHAQAGIEIETVTRSGWIMRPPVAARFDQAVNEEMTSAIASVA